MPRTQQSRSCRSGGRDTTDAHVITANVYDTVFKVALPLREVDLFAWQSIAVR